MERPTPRGRVPLVPHPYSIVRCRPQAIPADAAPRSYPRSLSGGSAQRVTGIRGVWFHLCRIVTMRHDPSSRTAAFIARPFRAMHGWARIRCIHPAADRAERACDTESARPDTLRLWHDRRFHRPERRDRFGCGCIPDLARLAGPADVAHGMVRGTGDFEYRVPDMAAMTAGHAGAGGPVRLDGLRATTHPHPWCLLAPSPARLTPMNSREARICFI